MRVGEVGEGAFRVLVLVWPSLRTSAPLGIFELLPFNPLSIASLLLALFHHPGVLRRPTTRPERSRQTNHAKRASRRVSERSSVRSRNTTTLYRTSSDARGSPTTFATHPEEVFDVSYRGTLPQTFRSLSQSRPRRRWGLLRDNSYFRASDELRPRVIW